MTLRAVLVASMVVLFAASPASAGGKRSERMHAQAQKLGAIESQLTEDDLDALDKHSERIDRILQRFQSAAPAAKLTCLSNGQAGSYEKFTVTDATTGTAFEKGTSLSTCNQLISVQSQNLICTSNGEAGSYEKFGVYDLARKQLKGGLTSLKSCLQLVGGARGPFVCQSNGQAGSYEKFHLYNRDTDKTLGGDTLLEQCLASVPN